MALQSNFLTKMNVLFLCVCLLVSTGLARGAWNIDSDRLAGLQADLVRQTFDVIEEAIDTQQQILEERIEALEARVGELEELLLAGAPANPPDQGQTSPVQPQPEPKPEPTTTATLTTVKTTTEATTTTQAPTTTKATTTEVTTTTEAPTTTKATTTTLPPPPILKTPETCQDLYDEGETANGLYDVDPKNTGNRIQVTCNFDGGVAKTIVHHDSESEVKNNGNRAPGRFVLAPRYDVPDLQRLGDLINASADCQQFIKIRCKSSVLFRRKNTDYGWWLSRDGATMKSWGGARASETSQACAGETQCKCDTVGRGTSFDEGLLTDKEYLPVRSVHLGDTGGKKQMSWLTLGELVCSGKSRKLPLSSKV